MCCLCQASSTLAHLLFTRCGPDAGWRATRRSHESYLAEIGANIPILFLIAIGLRLECVMIDILHTVDLGVAAHIIGNMFWGISCRAGLGQHYPGSQLR